MCRPMRLLGTSPARARRALIQETAAKDHPTMVQPQPDVPMLDRLDSLERLLREESASPVENIPARPPSGESGPDTPAESDVASSLPPAQGPEPASGSPTEPVPQRGRPPASRQVAEKLRERYAVGPALAWSKR